MTEMTKTNKSWCKEVGIVSLPCFTGTRIMMMPFLLGDSQSIPGFMSQYESVIGQICEMVPHSGGVGYLTIDERALSKGESHRRPGLHVDGVYRSGAGGWGGGECGWGGRGMMTVSNTYGCRAWDQELRGTPGNEGECDHLAFELRRESQVDLRAGGVYWMGPLCVHESMPQPQNTHRIFVRISMPSKAPWFEGYTENPLGIKPTGPILPRRHEFMSFGETPSHETVE